MRKKKIENEVTQWVNGQIEILDKRQKKNRKFYSILTLTLSLLNLAVITMACFALSSLVRNRHIPGVTLQIIMASLAASVTILIFVINTINIMYRSFMKWGIYKAAMNEIEHEVMKMEYDHKDYNVANPKSLLEKRIKAIMHNALSSKREKKLSSMLLVAISGGENA